MTSAGNRSATIEEDMPMAEQQKDQQTQVPAHSTEEEKARLKDKNKEGIPPGAE